MINYQKINSEALTRILRNFGDPRNIRVFYVSVYKKDFARTESITNLLIENKIKFVKYQANGFFKYIKVFILFISI